MPLALTMTSPVKNYDSGGVSIEGSKPRDGHLGANRLWRGGGE